MEQPDINPLQKLFLNISQLRLGTNTVSLSPLSVSQYANNGINATFFNNHTYLFILAGKQLRPAVFLTAVLQRPCLHRTVRQRGYDRQR